MRHQRPILTSVLIVLFLAGIGLAQHGAQFYTGGSEGAADHNILVCSTDGLRVYTYHSGYLIRSTDGGRNWERCGGMHQSRDVISTSADGMTVVMDGYDAANPAVGTRLWLSKDGGDTWDEMRPTGDDASKTWWVNGCSADGTRLYAAQSNYGGGDQGRMYRSVNSGAEWDEIRPLGDIDTGWVNFYCSADGMRLLAQARNASDSLATVCVSNDGGDTWTEVRPNGSAGIYYRMTMSSDGLTILAAHATYGSGRVYISTNGGTSWTETQPLGNVGSNWNCTAMSADGIHMMVAVNGGKVYSTDDGGATWAETTPAGTSVNAGWGFLHIAPDNSRRWAYYYSSALCMLMWSEDGGITWERFFHLDYLTNQFDSYDPYNPYTFASYARYIAQGYDANNLYMAQYSGRAWASQDAGENWTEMQPAGVANKWWQFVACDANGTYVVMGETGTGNGGRLYQSADQGGTWSEIRPGGNLDLNWRAGDCSDSGRYWIVGCSDGAVDGGRIYTSSNFGAAWTERRPLGDTNNDWRTVGISGDGVYMYAGINNGRLYRSANSGVAWAEIRPAGDTNQIWLLVIANHDGEIVVAQEQNGHLWVSVDYGVTWTARNTTTRSVAMSEDGRLLYMITSSSLRCSLNSGQTWSTITFPPQVLTYFTYTSTGRLARRVGSNEKVFLHPDIASSRRPVCRSVGPVAPYEYTEPAVVVENYLTDSLCVYADGKPMKDANGVDLAYTLDVNGVLDPVVSGTVVIYGLNYFSILETMPLVNIETIGRPTAIKSVAIDFVDTMGAHVGSDKAHSTDWTFSTDDFNTPMDPYTGYKPVMGYSPFLRGMNRQPVVYVWEWSPTPLTIRSITANMEITAE
jgi:photosystem II stability/assembly factor-like uncharacterized protein